MTLILTMIFYFSCAGSDQSYIRPFKSKRGTSHDLHDVILQLYIHNKQNGENEVQWNPHNTHMQTQMGHSTIVCITGPQKKCRRHCFIDYVKDSEQKSLGTQKRFCCLY